MEAAIAGACGGRVWRGIKYEEIYLRAYESVSHARRSIGDYIELYNRKRPHSSLADQTLDRRADQRTGAGEVHRQTRPDRP
ncbi:integrase core domain-containing protein [Burkholderia theae]|uniref:integrase core domain-containing protein n=1 Tax=Burkholderia theae TaxID=3143496 RepID=UPI003AFB3CFA